MPPEKSLCDCPFAHSDGAMLATIASLDRMALDCYCSQAPMGPSRRARLETHTTRTPGSDWGKALAPSTPFHPCRDQNPFETQNAVAVHDGRA